MKTDLFQSYGHYWVSYISWHIECTTFTASSFRIWNSSTGIPSPSLALFVVMLPKAHLTLHSKMSGCRWVITPLWLSGSWKSFLYSSSVYSCHLFLISSASVRSVLYCAHLCMKCSFGISNFLEEIAGPSHSIDSLYFFALIAEGFFFFLSLLAIFWKSAFKWVYRSFFPLPLASLLLSAICKSSSKKHFAFLHFFFLEMVFITASCTMSWTSIHSSSGTLSDLIPWIYLSLPLYNHKGFELGHTWMV